VKPERKPRSIPFLFRSLRQAAGWSLEVSRRRRRAFAPAKLGKERLKAVIDRSKASCACPPTTGSASSRIRHRRGGAGPLVSAGGTRCRRVGWESFGAGWVTDVRSN